MTSLDASSESPFKTVQNDTPFDALESEIEHENDRELALIDAEIQKQVLNQTNVLLGLMGFGKRTFEEFDDLVASISSMSVALYEKMFQFRLENIARVPQDAQDYEHNAQIVVDALAGALLDESFEEQQLPSKLSGKSLCNGDIACIAQVIKMFTRIYEVLYANQEYESVHDIPELREHAPKGKKPAQNNTDSSKKKAKKKVAKVQQVPSLAEQREAYLREQRARNIRPKAKSSVAVTPTPATPAAQTAQTATPTRSKSPAVVVQEVKKTRKATLKPPVPTSTARKSATSLLKKRTRKSDPSKKTLTSTTQTQKQMAQMSISSATKANQSQNQEEVEEDLLETQKYGRFISNGATTNNEQPSTSEVPFFAGMSSVSYNGSSLLEETENVAQNDKTIKEKEPVDRSTRSPLKKKAAIEAPPQAKFPLTTKGTASSRSDAQQLRYKILLKEHLQALRQRELAEKKQLQRVFSLGEHQNHVNKIREKRLQQDLRLHRIAIGLQQKTSEEKNLKNAMRHMLKLEKERLRDETKRTNDILKKIQKEHEQKEIALQKFFETQMQLVKEKTEKEVKEREMVEKAKKMASEQLLRGLKRDREEQLRTLLEEKKHLAEVQRFQNESLLNRIMEENASSLTMGEKYNRTTKSSPLKSTKFTTKASSSRK